MSKIVLRANMGTKERPNIRNKEISKEISEKLLALFLASTKEELQSVANEVGVHGNPVFNEKTQTAVLHYSIDGAIKLLIGLRDRAIRSGDDKRGWLTKLDPTQNEIDIILDTGSDIKFVKS